MPVELYGPVAGGGAQTVQTQNCVDVTLAGNSTSAGAGYILISSGTMTLAGGNNITLSQNGNHVSIVGAAAGTGGGISGISAGTQLGTSGTISFANSNNITFGLSGSSVLTASFSGLTGGVSSGGNTAGTTGTVSNGLLFFGGSNVTLSQSSGVGGATITFIGGSGGSFSGGVSSGGNTLGTTGTVSNGILFVGGTNITLSQSSAAGGATVTVIGPAPGTTQSAQTGISSIQASDATYTSGQVIFTGAGIVTVQSGVGQSVVINASTSQSLQTSGLFQATLAGNSTSAGAGYILFSSGTVTIAGGNNITLSQNGNAFTISGPNLGGAQTGISGIAGSAASTVTAGTVQFANSNNMSFGLNGSTMTASFSVTNTAPPIATQVYAVSGVGSTGTVTRFSPEDHVHVGVAGINASGTASTFVGNVMLSGTNITLVTAGASNAGSIGFSVANPGGGGTISQWMPPGFGFSTFSQMGQSSLVMFPALLQMNAVVSRADLFGSLSISTSSNSSQQGNLSLQVGIYTRNVSTMSLATSGSQSYSWSITGTTSSTSFSGFRGFTVPLAATMTPGEYFIGVLSLTATTNANWITISNLALEAFNSGYVGPFGAATNASNQLVAGLGVFSAQTAALPASVAFGGLLATSAGTVRPVVNLLNYTA